MVYTLDDLVNSIFKNPNNENFIHDSSHGCSSSFVRDLMDKGNYNFSPKCPTSCEKCPLYLTKERGFKYKLSGYIISGSYEYAVSMLEHAICVGNCKFCNFHLPNNSCVFKNFKKEPISLKEYFTKMATTIIEKSEEIKK